MDTSFCRSLLADQLSILDGKKNAMSCGVSISDVSACIVRDN